MRKRVTLISWEAEHIEQQIGQAFYRQKPFYQHITYGLQSDWLHVCKAILLVQTSPATCLQSNSIGTNGAGFCSNLGARWLFTGCILISWLQVTRWGGESHHFTGSQNPSPGRLPAPAPAAPHNKTYFSASKTNKKNIRHMNYRH